jgi:hypothetical protein
MQCKGQSHDSKQSIFLLPCFNVQVLHLITAVQCLVTVPLGERCAASVAQFGAALPKFLSALFMQATRNCCSGHCLFGAGRHHQPWLCHPCVATCSFLLLVRVARQRDSELIVARMIQVPSSRHQGGIPDVMPLLRIRNGLDAGGGSSVRQAVMSPGLPAVRITE